VNKYESKEEMPPVIALSSFYVISIYRDGLFLLGITAGDVPPLLVIEFLYRVFDVFADYMGGSVEENSVRENFTTVRFQLIVVSCLPLQ
jgi:AP-3 complex subunit mu